MTVTSTKNILKIEFTKGDYGNSTKEAPITPSTGKYSNYVWTGSASEIEFSVGSPGQLRFTQAKFTFGEGSGETGGETGENGGGETTQVGALEALAIEVCKVIFTDVENPVLDEDYFFDDTYGDCYSIFVQFDNTTEDDLQDVVEEVVTDLADLMTIDGEIEAYTDSNVGSGYEAYCYNDDESIEINIYSYMYNSLANITIDIYEA